MTPTRPDPASDFDPTREIVPEPLFTPWSLEIQAPPEIRQELLARILAARPWWDAYPTQTGLAVTFDLKDGPPEPTPAVNAPNEPPEAPSPPDESFDPNQGLEELPDPNPAVCGPGFDPTGDPQSGPDPLGLEDDPKNRRLNPPSTPPEGSPDESFDPNLDFDQAYDEKTEKGAQTPLGLVQSLLEQLSRGRYRETKIRLRWQPPWRAKKDTLNSLGIFKIQETIEPPAPSLLPPAPSLPPPARVILSPEPIRLNPRLKAWTQTAAQALVSHFTPPIGAPSTKGGRVLIIDEDPALLGVLTLLLGAAEVEAVCSHPFMAEKAKKLCALNNLGHRLKVTLVGPPPLPKQIEENWSGRFGLIVINLSPYQTVKRLKKISSHFESIRGRLIISGLHRGGQITFVLKAATRNGLALIESAAEDEDWATLTLATRRFQDVPVQKWQPGDWVTHLTQDEMEILDEVDRADSAPNEPSPNDEPQNAQT